MRKRGKILHRRTDHRWQYGTCALNTGYLRLQTHSECIIFIPFPLQHWLHLGSSMLHYTFIACLVRRNVIQYAK